MQWIGATGHHLGSDKDEQQVSGTVQRATGHAAISANMAAEGIRGGARWKAGKDKELRYGNNRNTEKKGTAQNNDTRSENASTNIENKTSKKDLSFQIINILPKRRAK